MITYIMEEIVSYSEHIKNYQSIRIIKIKRELGISLP